MLTVGAGLAGCSDEAESEPWPPGSSRALDRKVLALEPDMSVESVRERLGEPLSERQFEDEPTVDMLFYGRWQLVFADDELERRVKYVFERPLPDPQVVDQRERALDRKVLNLQPGMPIAAVKLKFGKPDTYTIFKNAPGKEEALSYESWELTFVGGALERRNKW